MHHQILASDPENLARFAPLVCGSKSIAWPELDLVGDNGRLVASRYGLPSNTLIHSPTAYSTVYCSVKTSILASPRSPSPPSPLCYQKPPMFHRDPERPTLKSSGFLIEIPAKPEFKGDVTSPAVPPEIRVRSSAARVVGSGAATAQQRWNRRSNEPGLSSLEALRRTRRWSNCLVTPGAWRKRKRGELVNQPFHLLVFGECWQSPPKKAKNMLYLDPPLG